MSRFIFGREARDRIKNSGNQGKNRNKEIGDLFLVLNISWIHTPSVAITQICVKPNSIRPYTSRGWHHQTIYLLNRR